MTEHLSVAEQALEDARKQFVGITNKTFDALKKESRTLSTQLKRVNDKITKIRAKATAAQQRVIKTGSEAAADQLENAKAMLTDLRADGNAVRENLQMVRSQLFEAKQYLEKATGLDKAVAAWEKTFARKTATKKRASKKKAASKKKTTVKKRVGSKKKTAKKSMNKKKVTTRRVAAKKKLSPKKKRTANR